MIRMTDEACARCTNKLATSNHHKDRLCGECQRELGSSRGKKSLAYREWIDHGKRREVERKPEASSPIMAALALDTPILMELAAKASAELDRRRREAEELIRLLNGGEAPTKALS